MRVRYAQPTRDSTRMFVQLWGRCVDRERPNCLRDELVFLVAGIQEAEAPPPE